PGGRPPSASRTVGVSSRVLSALVLAGSVAAAAIGVVWVDHGGDSVALFYPLLAGGAAVLFWGQAAVRNLQTTGPVTGFDPGAACVLQSSRRFDVVALAPLMYLPAAAAQLAYMIGLTGDIRGHGWFSLMFGSFLAGAMVLAVVASLGLLGYVGSLVVRGFPQV